MAAVSINMDSIKQLVAQIQAYFSRLSQLEMIGWGLIGLGLVLLIVALIIM